MPRSDQIELRGFDHMQMEVRDLEESIEFYRRHFGFEVHQVGVRMARRWAIVGTRGYFLALHEDKAKAAQTAAGIRITHFGLVTGDFVGARAQLAAAGVRLEPDEMIEYETSRSFYFFDPNGYKIEISEVWGGGLAPRSPA